MEKLINTFDHILGIYFKITAYISVLIIAIATLFITAEIIARLFFNHSFQIVIQFGGYSLFIITFLSAGWVLRENAHVVVDFFVSKFQDTVRRNLDLVVFFMSFILCCFLFFESTQYAISALQRGHMTTYPLKIPTFYLLIVMPIGWLTLGIEFLLQLLKKSYQVKQL